MEKSSQDIIFFITTVTFVLLLLVVVVVSLLLFSRNRRLKHNNEKLQMNADFQQELNSTKHEVMEQVFADVSAELHDNIGQTLTVAVQNLNRVKDDESGQVNEAREIIRRAMQDIRDVSHLLSRDYWNKFSINESLDIVEQQLGRLKNIKTSFHITEDITLLEKDKEILVFRVIQELINNSLKHSKADAISLTIDHDPGFLKVKYEDNGVGIKRLSLPKSYGLGMSSIKTRMELCKATWEIKSPAERGFLFEATIPL